MNDLFKRLEILKSAEAITENAHIICHKTIEAYVSEAEAANYQMLITHLAMAMTRVERNEPLNPPPSAVMAEIYHSPNLEEARRRVNWIEEEFNIIIPEEEREFLYMHFVTVLTA